MSLADEAMPTRIGGVSCADYSLVADRLGLTLWLDQVRQQHAGLDLGADGRGAIAMLSGCATMATVIPAKRTA